MKRCLLLLASIVTLAAGMAQSAAAQGMADSTIQKFFADYAVPDAPALTLLGTDESNLVRPATVRELAISLAEFTGENGLQLPKAVAVEFSPGMLFFGRRLTLKQYQKSAALYRLRISLATRRQTDDGPQSSLAVGLRTSLSDDADPRTSKVFRAAAARIFTRVAAIEDSAADAAESGGINARPTLTPAQQGEIENLTREYELLGESLADDTWNKKVFDVAIGFLANADTAGNNIEAQQYAAWATYGSPIGGWGQLLIGVKMSSDRDSVSGDFGTVISGAGRFYGGSNQRKVYLDVQASKASFDDTQFALTGGAEMRILKGMWASLSVANEWGGEGPDGRLRARFGFKTAFR